MPIRLTVLILFAALLQCHNHNIFVVGSDEPTTDRITIKTSDKETDNGAVTDDIIDIETADVTDDPTTPDSPYCAAELCELYNGTHVVGQLPHIACHNNGSFAYRCGAQPQLIEMNERRRNLILDLHNLARSRVANGQVPGYETAAHMPMLKWDNELASMAELHVKRCRFAHDSCRNTPQYPLSGQNIGYFWIGRTFKSHSKRMKSFIVSWFREFVDANQTFIDDYQPHPEGKKIGHFTMMMADRAHHLGCAAIRYREPNEPENMKFLLTCNYDYTNIIGEPIYHTGASASKCAYKVSTRFPALCDWQQPQYEYKVDNGEQNANTSENLLYNNV